MSRDRPPENAIYPATLKIKRSDRLALGRFPLPQGFSMPCAVTPTAPSESGSQTPFWVASARQRP